MPHRLPARPHLPSTTDGLTIGLMGGSFDPPHSGHAHVIATVQRALNLDRVWVLVSPGNPLKKTQTALGDRLGAAQRRLGGPRVRVSALEGQLGTRYTIHMLRRLTRLAPNARFVWIMGGDNLRDFHRWKDWRHIANLAAIVVVSRPGAMPKAGLSRFAQQYAQYRLPPSAAATLARHKLPAWLYLTAPLDPTSSTGLRAQTAQLQAMSPI